MVKKAKRLKGPKDDRLKVGMLKIYHFMIYIKLPQFLCNS